MAPWGAHPAPAHHQAPAACDAVRVGVLAQPILDVVGQGVGALDEPEHRRRGARDKRHAKLHELSGRHMRHALPKLTYTTDLGSLAPSHAMHRLASLDMD